MFYRDLVLTVSSDDVRFFRDSLLIKLHEQHHRLGCAVSFPHWQDGSQENQVDSFDTFTRYANPGPVIRLFAATAEVLEAVPAVLGVEELMQKNVLIVSGVRQVPQGCRGVAYCRSRMADGHIRRARQQSQDLRTRQELEARMRKQLHRQAYVKLGSTKGQVFSLHIERREADAASDALNVTSYGLSRSSEPCFLPDF